MFTNRLKAKSFNIKEPTKTEIKEKNWDQRFVLSKIPPYDAFKDSNYLSLGLMKSKIKYENYLEKEKERKKKLRGKTPRYTEHYVIDSQTGNKTSKEKNRRIFFTSSNENAKNNFAKTFSYNKLKGNKNSNNTLNKENINLLTSEDADLNDEFEIIKNMWNKLGVTKIYQENFVNLLNSLDDTENQRMYMNLEKVQMSKFKYELTQLLKRIIHRNDQISNLKQLIGLYENILKEKNTHPELENENMESLCNINENKVTENIHSCLSSLRITNINVVNQIKSFLMSNSYFLYMNKINLEKIKRDYYYNDDYLINMKTDLDFVQQSVLSNIYDFESFDGGDPFFLSFSKLKDEGEQEKKNESKQTNKKIKLDISKKILEEVQNCIYFMQQSEILHKSKKESKSPSKNRILDFLNCGTKIKEENCKKKGYGIGNLFKGNLEQDIMKLKMTKGYDRIFNFIKTNNSYENQNAIKERLKKSGKKKHNNIPLMTSQELKKKLSQYELLNELINEQNNENKKEEEFKKRDEEINMNDNATKTEEKKEDSEHDYNKEFETKDKLEEENKEEKELNEKKEEKQEKQEINEEKKEEEKKEENDEIKEDEKEEEKDEEKIEEKKENEIPKEEEKKDDEKEKEKELEKEEDKQIEQNEKQEEKIEENKEEKIEENKDVKEEEKKEEEQNERKAEEENVRKEEENEEKHSYSKIEEEIDAVIQQEKKSNDKTAILIPTYSAYFFTESLDKLTSLYNDYLSSNPTIYTPFTPNNSKDFIKGIYPKIIAVKEDKVTDDTIYGICGINYYINENQEYVLKINHISVLKNNNDILNKLIEKIENEILCNQKEIEIVEGNNIREGNDNILKILENHGYIEYNKDENKICMRKINTNDNIKPVNSIVNYDSLSVLSLINNDNNETLEKKYICFNKVINPINLSLLIDKLKINDKYKVEIISTDNDKISFIDKLSKLENQVFDFIKSQNNECANINEITNNEIKSKEGLYYSIINNVLNIQMNNLMTINIDNYLYNGIEINLKNNLIKDPKYNGNLYCLPTNNKNIFIIIYQYNEEFEINMSKDNNNIYEQFSKLFYIVIKNYISEVHDDNDNINQKTLWIPAFNINTNLFSSSLDINNYINIKNNENIEIKIKEYNEFLKLNYLPDDNKDKNVEININNSENDIIIKNKFLFGICHKEFMESFDVPVISLVNVTKDNFINTQ